MICCVLVDIMDQLMHVVDIFQLGRLFLLNILLQEGWHWLPWWQRWNGRTVKLPISFSYPLQMASGHWEPISE